MYAKLPSVKTAELSVAKKLSDRAEVLLHQLRVLLHGLAERAEDDAELGQLAAERRRDRDRVEHRVHGDAGEQLLFLERNSELGEGAAQLRIDLVQAVQHRLLLRRRVVADRLVVDRVVVDVVPGRLLHVEPGPVRLQPELEQPLGLVLLLRDRTNHVLVQARRNRVGFDVGDEAVLVLARRELLDGLGRGAHALKLVPHPQVLFAFGLLNMNPLLTRLVS